MEFLPHLVMKDFRLFFISNCFFIVVDPVLVNETRSSKPEGRLWWDGQLFDYRGTILFSYFSYCEAFYKLGMYGFLDLQITTIDHSKLHFV
jgi:hypothetical protein